MRSIMITLLLVLTSVTGWTTEILTGITKDGCFIQTNKAIYVVENATFQKIASKWQANDQLNIRYNLEMDVILTNLNASSQEVVGRSILGYYKSRILSITPMGTNGFRGWELKLIDGTPWDVFNRFSFEMDEWQVGDPVVIIHDAFLDEFEFLVNFSKGSSIPFFIGNQGIYFNSTKHDNQYIH